MAEERFLIQGGKPLSGQIEIVGCKNAATPIITASLLTDEPCYIQNLPQVEDIFRMLEIVKTLGAEVDFRGKRDIKIKAKDINPLKVQKKLVKKLRSSVFLLGPLLARFGKVKIPQPGGCLIGVRPIGAHLEGFSQLGAKMVKEKEEYMLLLKKLKPREVVLPEFSVTATENILMAAALLPGKTVIKIAALEPHVKDLACVLSKMGASVKWTGDHTVEIKGKRKLHGFSHSLIYDAAEAGSFLILAGVTGGNISIKNVPLSHLDLVILKLREFGIKIEKIKEVNGASLIRVHRPKLLLPVQKIQVLPYPGIPTDLQCAFGVLATQNPGETLIHDPMYEERLRYLGELNRMGADISIIDSHQAIVRESPILKGVSIRNYDLRSGAALIIAGLVAKGETTVYNTYQVDRGYEKIEKRLQKIGADIKRV